MKRIQARRITEAVSDLFQQACLFLPEDVLAALRKARDIEESPRARNVLDRLLENSEIAAGEGIPLCQDTGTAVVFLELGQDAHIEGGDLYEAVNEGVRLGYESGFLRKSIVESPFLARTNSGDNTPAVIHTDIVPGGGLKITVMPKGGGAENTSRMTMLTPAQGRQGVIDFVVKTVDENGVNACPPLILGVGIGGTAEQSMLLAKKSLLREVGRPSDDPENTALEREILERVNALGIGPAGFGGRTTALAVHVESFPTHIASLPVAVNIQCHSARHREAAL